MLIPYVHDFSADNELLTHGMINKDIMGKEWANKYVLIPYVHVYTYVTLILQLRDKDLLIHGSIMTLILQLTDKGSFDSRKH